MTSSYFESFVRETRKHAAKAQLRSFQHQPREVWPSVSVTLDDYSICSFADAIWQLEGKDLLVIYLHDGSEARRFPEGTWQSASEIGVKGVVMTTVYAATVKTINDARTA